MPENIHSFESAPRIEARWEKGDREIISALRASDLPPEIDSVERWLEEGR